MKIHNIDKGSNGGMRLNFSVGPEEVDLIFAIIDRAFSVYPRTNKNESDFQRLKSIRRELSEFVGRAKTKIPKSSDYPCPLCKRYLRSEKAIQQHLEIVHKSEPKMEV